MKTTKILILILCLILVEHIMLPVAISIQELVSSGQWYFNSNALGFQLRFLLLMFVIRLAFWILPLLLIFTQVANKIGVRNIFFFALLNVISNILIIGLCSITWFPGLITLPATNLTIVITFISPFIVNMLPVSRHYVQAFINEKPVAMDKSS
ncbi:MAG: hypothetical protein H6662_03720 [Ardenticatenaceae bacterium]|nr:hypothetical protein [Ardenticatenaceae bacterium]MCB9002911.1 hypothetical protein [Ardenticatenaceae bacterium]